MLRWIIVGVLVAVAVRVDAAGETSLEDLVRQADANMARLTRIAEELERLENEALTSNQVDRASCVRKLHDAAVGLLDGMKPLHKRLSIVVEEGDKETAQESVERILAACRRAETQLEAAKNCKEDPTTPGVRSRRPRRNEGLLEPVTPYTPPEATPAGPRDGCFRQERLACLLIRAMELEGGEEGAKSTCAESMARRGIKPLQGWEPTRCVTPDEFWVVIVRALELPVEDPKDPASYLQALREEGLPVEILMTGRPTQPVTIVTEAQARAFMAGGYVGSFLALPRRP